MARVRYITLLLSPTLRLKSPENFGKSADREVPFFATFGKSLSPRALQIFLYENQTRACLKVHPSVGIHGQHFLFTV